MQNQIVAKLRLFFTLIGFLVLLSCKKEKHQPDVPGIPVVSMEYFNLNNHEIKAGIPGFPVDLNHDGRNDLFFSTLLVGDPLNQVDKLQFVVLSNIKVNLPVKTGEEVPVMQLGDVIPLGDFNSYHWFELSGIVLVQKIISFTQPDFWTGHWKSAVHRYLPIQIASADKLFNGWVEISVDLVNEKVIIHKAALSREPNKIVKAGL